MRRYLFLLLGLSLVFLPTGCSQDDNQVGPDVSTGAWSTFEEFSELKIYAGRAIGIEATVLDTTTTIADTGPLPGTGGTLMATLAIASVPDVVSANDVLASTIGEDLQVRSEASAQTLNISLGDNTITATSIEVGATAGCDAESESGVALDANTTITGLIVNGEQITVTGDPDQEVPLLGGQLLLNQQTFSSNEDMLSIDVVGLSASVDSLGQVDVGIASAGMTCPTGEPCEDFITGGGWIMGTPSGSKATFAVSGGLHEDDADWGHLTYHEHDRADGVKIKGTGVSDYTVIDEVTRRIEGSANVSGEGAVTYVIEVRDMGEPGRADTFSIELSNGYSASGTLGGGNIQLHECP